MKILFAGGGTAGHINPALAIAGYVKERQPDAEILYIGAAGGMEERLVPQAGFPFRGITVQGFRRKISFSALKENIGGCTFIIVAQRINTILDADQIIVLDDGKIAGKGTHEELLANCKIYKEIALSQLSEEELRRGVN